MYQLIYIRMMVKSTPTRPLSSSNSENGQQELTIFPCLADCLSAEELNLVLSMLITSIDIKYMIDVDAIAIELRT